jgi:NitT/TauT family transport system ATP-binding protein
MFPTSTTFPTSTGACLTPEPSYGPFGQTTAFTDTPRLRNRVERTAPYASDMPSVHQHVLPEREEMFPVTAGSGARADTSVRVKGLSVRLGGRDVLVDIDLAVRPHEFVSIVGPSGCGKTTLLNCIAGFLPPDRGTVSVGGEVVRGPGVDRVVVFQEDAVFPWLRVRDNVAYGLRVGHVPRAERQERSAEALRLVGLAGWERAWPKELSGGMRKRVDMARALAVRPQVLLMDEPYGALDMMTKERLQADFEEIFDRSGMTVIFVTHDLEEAIYLSDRVLVLADRDGPVSASLEVPFVRPRASGIKLTGEFQQLRGRLAGLIRSVSAAGTGGEGRR